MDFDQGQRDIRPQNSDMYRDDGPHPEGHVVYVKNPRYECGSEEKKTMQDNSRAKHEVSREIRMSEMDTYA